MYYLSQSYFDLTKWTIWINSKIKSLIKQNLKDVENFYDVFAGFD